MYRAKMEGRRPSERQLRQGCAELRLYCQRWDSLRIGPDGLLTMTLAAHNRHPERKRVVCPAAVRRGLVRDAHQQAHVGVQRVLTKLQLRWYWPNMGRDVRRRVRQCEICQVNKHGILPGEAGRRRLYAGRPQQVKAVNLVKPMPMTPKENSGENPPLLEPRRQTTRGRQRHGPGYKVVMLRSEDLARQERPSFTLLHSFRSHSNDHLPLTGPANPFAYGGRIGNGMRTTRGAPPTTQMGVAGDGAEN